MQKITLGRTGLVVPRNGFGALPIQRISQTEAISLIRRALDGGMYYFDTARFYTDSEAKLGLALEGHRHEVVISTKTGATTAEAFWADLATSLRLLRTDYIDLYQFHNPAFCPRPDDGTGLYEAMLQAQQQGKILHIGITNHRQSVALQAIESGLYETLQYPFSYLASADDLRIVSLTQQANMGFIAMKGLAGGLITRSDAAYAYLAQFPHVAPSWGLQRQSELSEWLSYQDNPPSLTPALQRHIDHDRADLSGDFCRGCAYCQPCPAGIQIQDCNRMSLFLRRAPHSVYLTEEWLHKMEKIDGCLHCGHCTQHCPYGLDTPTLLRRNYADFLQFWNARQQA